MTCPRFFALVPRFSCLLLFASLAFSCNTDNPTSTETANEQNTVNEPATYQNPILAGFYPDPTICRVDDKFYLTTSTFSYFPGLPIFESDDLVNWRQIGHAMDRPSQLNTISQGVSRGLFAPAISFHDGIFYIVCTQVDRGGNFVITATDPAGPWSDPTYLPGVDGIDPSLYFEGDKTYLVYNSVAPDNKPLYSGHRTIRMREVDRETLTASEAEITLVNGGVDLSQEPVWIEAPHIYRIGDYYYLMCAEGGTAYNHSEVIFRSKSVTGPYEPWDQNPILTQRHLDPSRPNPVTTAGHADMVQLDNGEWWAVFLACRPYEGNYFNIGRETFLTPVEWQDGWPVINPDFETVQYSYPTPLGTSIDSTLMPLNGNFVYTDEFEEATLGPEYLLLRTPTEKWYMIGDGQLTLDVRSPTASGLENPSFIGRRQQHHTGSISTEINFAPAAPGERAGLLAFQSESHHYLLAKTLDENGAPAVQLLRSTENDLEVLASQAVSEAPIQLRISFAGANYDFEYSTDGKSWKSLKKNVDGKFLSTEDAGGFVGTLLAMYATSSGASSENKADFARLTYVGNDPVYQ